jgi:hypothetical protein
VLIFEYHQVHAIYDEMGCCDAAGGYGGSGAAKPGSI